MIGCKGNHISHMNFAEYAKKYGSPFWDFHRASLHKCLLGRVIELGSKVLMKSRVSDVGFGEVSGVCTVLLHDRRMSVDLVVGADRINSVMRECSGIGTSLRQLGIWSIGCSIRRILSRIPN